MFAEYGFHPRVQRWVIGQCLCSEQRSLASYGVCRDGDTAFLYLLSARHARLSRLQCQQDQESALLTPAPKPPPTPQPASHDWRGYSTLPPRLHHSNTGAASSSGAVSALKHSHSLLSGQEFKGNNLDLTDTSVLYHRGLVFKAVVAQWSRKKFKSSKSSKPSLFQQLMYYISQPQSHIDLDRTTISIIR